MVNSNKGAQGSKDSKSTHPPKQINVSQHAHDDPKAPRKHLTAAHDWQPPHPPGVPSSSSGAASIHVPHLDAKTSVASAPARLNTTRLPVKKIALEAKEEDHQVDGTVESATVTNMLGLGTQWGEHDLDADHEVHGAHEVHEVHEPKAIPEPDTSPIPVPDKFEPEVPIKTKPLQPAPIDPKPSVVRLNNRPAKNGLKLSNTSSDSSSSGDEQIELAKRLLLLQQEHKRRNRGKRRQSSSANLILVTFGIFIGAMATSIFNTLAPVLAEKTALIIVVPLALLIVFLAKERISGIR